MNIKPINVLIQLNGKLNKFIEGSKIENKIYLNGN